MQYRIEKDTMGEVKVPQDAYWGAQTQRSIENFKIGEEKMPTEIIRAFAALKRGCAKANFELGKLDERRYGLISLVCDEIEEGKLDGNFPLVVWQTGSGTQSNMNVNEVIANRANEMAGEKLIHPNDHVNMSQSSNDTFPAAMHIAAIRGVDDLLPAIDMLRGTLLSIEEQNEGIIKSGRTHLMDAVPIAFSQEVSGWRGMLESSREQIVLARSPLMRLAIGGTAVGTGLNAGEGFAPLAAMYSGEGFVSSKNKFHSLTAKDELVFAHGAIKGLAANLMKIANDIRWMASGPRCGFGEIFIPENEPGSSIMPGKVNPTQCEAVTMVAVQVMGNDTAIGIAASQGNFELNVFMPVLIYNFLQSARLLKDVIISFDKNCVSGIKVNKEAMKGYLDKTLMLVTCLNPHIGYDRAAQAVKLAHKEGLLLKDAVTSLGFMTGEDFDRLVRPESMI